MLVTTRGGERVTGYAGVGVHKPRTICALLVLI